MTFIPNSGTDFDKNSDGVLDAEELSVRTGAKQRAGKVMEKRARDAQGNSSPIMSSAEEGAAAAEAGAATAEEGAATTQAGEASVATASPIVPILKLRNQQSNSGDNLVSEELG